MIIPVIIGTTGTVTHGLKKNSEAKPGKYSIDSLKKKKNSYGPTWNITRNTESTVV